MLRAIVEWGRRHGRSLRGGTIAGAAALSLGLGAAGVLALEGAVSAPRAPGLAAAQVTTREASNTLCPERDGGQTNGEEVALLSTALQDASPEDGAGGVTVDLSVADVAERANPAVVTITSLTNGFGSQAVPVGAGSGFIIDAEGHVVTNNHVVEGADELTVQFLDGTAVPATVVGRDDLQDIAVLQLKLSGEERVPGIAVLGDSSAVRPGDQVVAIGSSLGELTNTVSDGTVGAIDRELYGLPNLIQHDAEIYPGNSGGPLLNLRGEVVGVNVAGIGGGRGTIEVAPARIGFAIASDAVREIVDELIANGAVARPYLGITGEQTSGGQVVVEVLDGTPAAEAGLLVGDVITAVDGEAIDGRTSLLDLLLEREPGDSVALTVDRSGSEQEIEVVLGQRPPESE